MRMRLQSGCHVARRGQPALGTGLEKLARGLGEAGSRRVFKSLQSLDRLSWGQDGGTSLQTPVSSRLHAPPSRPLCRARVSSGV